MKTVGQAEATEMHFYFVNLYAAGERSSTKCVVHHLTHAKVSDMYSTLRSSGKRAKLVQRPCAGYVEEAKLIGHTQT